MKPEVKKILDDFYENLQKIIDDYESKKQPETWQVIDELWEKVEKYIPYAFTDEVRKIFMEGKK